MATKTKGSWRGATKGEGGAQAAGRDPGALPESGEAIINSVAIGTPVPGGGEADAPSVSVSVDLVDTMLAAITDVSVLLVSPTGRTASASAEKSDGDNLQLLTIELDEYDPSGEWALAQVTVTFDTDANPDLPASHIFGADAVSSLAETRFVTLDVPDEDRSAPEITSLDLPSRSFTIASDNPFSTGDDDSVEISFTLNVADPSSGLNLIEFEFDIGEGSPAVAGGEWGLFGDIPGGEIGLSTFNTEAPAGDYILTRLRISDDQGNTHLLGTEKLQEMGFETIINVAARAALEDSSAPAVSSFSLAQAVTVGADGGSLVLAFEATDNGLDDTGVTSASLTLRSDKGGLYQLNAPAVLNDDNTGGTATFAFNGTFPAGNFTVERLSLNDAAYNRATLALTDRSFTVINPYGGDSGANRMIGDAAANVIAARSGNDTVIGGDGDDSLTLGDGNDISWAGAGDTGSDTVIGGAGDDIIGGGAGNDLIIGGQLSSSDIRDLVFVAYEQRLDGEDSIFGGAGDDTIHGGNPLLDGETDDSGKPYDYGSTARNVLYSGTGNDKVYGARGDDVIGGGQGDDIIFGGDGHDVIYGGKNDGADTGINDVIDAGEGNDVVFASGGDDEVSGGADNDTLFGGAGDDSLGGNGGHDVLYGGTGDDFLSGGTGDDAFYFKEGSGADTVLDFGLGEDTLMLEGYSDRFDSIAEIVGSAHLATQNGVTGLMLELGEGDSIFLVGIDKITDLVIVL
ncbi:calcium-binding protein [Kordiimonas lacus]|uniref:Ca2+-binding protein, RTX toxin-related n=1 Tax=Kordiimonas lacus TaxID=637679 RepID=A0A1G6VMG2_9PROT|nr:calcium-binding protein [Kordiimonas lacus]SDD54217.1 Ca2+-binding protein, RTX toxin-related [Kordiimonas lacus]